MGDCPDCDTNMPVEDWGIVFCPNCHETNWYCEKEPKEDRPQYCHKCGWSLYKGKP